MSMSRHFTPASAKYNRPRFSFHDPSALPAENEEVEIRFTRNIPHSVPCQVYFIHEDMEPEVRTLEENEDSIRGLNPGILNVVTVFESSNPGVFVSSATPVPVLPKDAAEEMCDIFERTIQQESKSDLLLSKDQSLSETQKSAIQEAIWHDHIRSFAVDLDFLLNDMDDEENESDDETHESTCDALLNVFRNLYEFLKKSEAHNTIQYLIQACKEQGVISFYSQYRREEETLKNDSQIALYEMAPKMPNLAPPCDAEYDENNDTAEFYQNFGFRNTGNNNSSSNTSQVESTVESSSESNQMPSMEQLCGFCSFDAFTRAGSLRSRILEDEAPGNNPMVKPQSPSSQEHPEEGTLHKEQERVI